MITQYILHDNISPYITTPYWRVPESTKFTVGNAVTVEQIHPWAIRVTGEYKVCEEVWYKSIDSFDLHIEMHKFLRQVTAVNVLPALHRCAAIFRSGMGPLTTTLNLLHSVTEDYTNLHAALMSYIELCGPEDIKRIQTFLRDIT